MAHFEELHPRLPQELVDHIIDHLHDDPRALSNCALVCHAWVPRSRSHFFAKVSLKATSPQNGVAIPQERCKRLYSLLLSSPDIICHIRELEICEGSPHHHHNPDVDPTAWVAKEETLPALFGILTHVQHFDFSSTSNFFWKSHPTFEAALCTLFSLPTITYIRLHSWIFPDFTSLAFLISHCQNLKAFALSSTAICGDGSLDLNLQPTLLEDSVDKQPTRLEVLTLDFVTFPYLEYWLFSHQSLLDITSIRELRVAHFHDAAVVEKLLTAVGGSLEHFHLKPGSWDVHGFDMSHNTGLRSIRLTLDDTETAIGWALSLLSSVTSNNIALKSIGLEFYADPKKIDGWRKLDSLLSQPELSYLRQVEIGLFAIPTHTDFTRVKEEMSNLGARSIVRWYQLGIKSQRPSPELTPRISRYEA